MAFHGGSDLMLRQARRAVYDHCASSDIPELTRLAKTIRRWEVPILR